MSCKHVLTHPTHLPKPLLHNGNAVIGTTAEQYVVVGLSFSIDGSTYYSIQPETSTTPGYYTDPNTTNTATSADGAPFDQPFYLLMNLAVGGTFSGNPTADTIFPQSLFIDYVRVYELA